ncbi:Non-specific lipid-transfer protein 4 [Striga hermonthica]|uniref:Non-specific lipid-transfer protein 4 n=1 Tax=Striga hermonthica TaxID=68872 RepID=A0A9N7RL25_STRHE|nr:Non-specific lipid-transfer protein 4 [Striga hermonthica]
MYTKVENRAVLILGMLVFLAAEPMVGAISCSDAITKLMPCQPFLLDVGSSVSVPCCEGAQSLSQLVGSKPEELKAACKCLKQAAAAMGVDVARAKQIPDLCSVAVPVPIDPNVDCDRLK